MVFIIQNTQNCDNMAMNIKLNALMSKLEITDKDIVEAEDASDKRLEKNKKTVQKNREFTTKSLVLFIRTS